MVKARPRHPVLEARAREWSPGTSLVECSGEVDIETAPRFREALDEGIGRRPRRLILDLSGVQFMDSVGVGHIVSVYKRLRPGVRLQICTRSPHIRMLLEMAGLNGVSSLHASLAEALQAAE
ncbi:MAG: STAS domain-containing protein [Armatimonadetes bacterium]|nr:STAS domain-containing protein [Armatimonadota bacterium]